MGTTKNRMRITAKILAPCFSAVIEQIAQFAIGNLGGIDGWNLTATSLVTVHVAETASGKGFGTFCSAHLSYVITVLHHCIVSKPTGYGGALIASGYPSRVIAITQVYRCRTVHVAPENAGHVLCRTGHVRLIAHLIDGHRTRVIASAYHSHKGNALNAATAVQREVMDIGSTAYHTKQACVIAALDVQIADDMSLAVKLTHIGHTFLSDGLVAGLALHVNVCRQDSL